ncbi:restriction endonuclease subunit S [Microvirga arabica]|uniref:restriction endonuclease subunit S n=1 Tax=Microvirga arabica TaxID=1128671 RepID=UPI0019395196|nr:restriction endonuclease subunit S [Microvirga arabica]MBM1170344.1 restriction endonuclease subunit S [Microvirga arabica]
MNTHSKIITDVARSRPLGELLEFRNEIVHPKDKPVGQAVFVGLEHVERDTGIRIGSEQIELGGMTGRRARFKEGDIVYGYLRPYLNKVWIAEFDGICSVDQYVFKVSSSVDRNYVAHFLRSDAFLRTAPIDAAPGQLPRIRSGEIAATPIPLPPLDEQRQIATILDKADALRRKRRRTLKLLNELLHSTFMEVFGNEIFGADPERFQPIASISTLQNGAYFPKEKYSLSKSGVEMVHMSDAFNGIVSRGELKRVNCSAADVAKYGLLNTDLLIARRSLNFEGAAKPCLIPNSEEPLIYESSFIRIRPHSEAVRAEYLFYYLSNSYVRQKYILPYITQSTISGINQSNLSKIPTLVPTIGEQERFINALNSIQRQRTKSLSALPAANELFSSLQQRAFSQTP